MTSHVIMGRWERAQEVLRWMRDKAFALLASFWMFILLAAIVAGIAVGFLMVDYMFVRSLAEFSPVPVSVLLTLAVSYRLFTMTYGMAAVWNKHRGLNGRSLRFKALGYTLALLLLMHCMALSFKMMGDQYASSSVIEEVAETRTSGNGDQIAALERMEADIRADRDANVSQFEAAIENITSDNLDNDDQAETYRQSIVAEQESARVALAEIREKRMALMTSSTVVKAQAQTDEASRPAFHPGFFGMARFVTGDWNPANEPSHIVAFICGVLFWLFFYAIGETMLMGIPPMSFSMMLHARKIAEEAEKDAKVRKEFTEEEWEEFQAAKDEKDRRNEGVKKGVKRRRQGNKIELAREYHQGVIDDLQAHLDNGGTVDGFAESRGQSVPHLKLTLQPYMSRAEFETFFGVHDVVVVNDDGEDNEDQSKSA